MTKNSRQLERHFKGIANHRRIDILLLLKQVGKLSLEDLAERLKCNVKTIAGHTLKLVNAGLLNKQSNGREVLHSLSPYGRRLINFIETFSHSRE